uniref:Ig-like domain-containing protein n=1 Tax=Chrysemys picta bellii TaxID=8478 RepID=A0A8C3PF06_CHRPI
MEVAAIAGESVQLQPVKLPEPWTEMTWEVTLDSAEMYRIVTFNKGDPPDLGSSPYFINRVTFHPENLSLQIDPVKKSDSGLYTLSRFSLVCVTDGSLLSERVRQPNLMVLPAHAELGQCNVTLSCSVPGADRVTYGWSRGTSRIPSDRDHQLHGHQSLLHVVINANSSDVFYRCNASNRASWGADTPWSQPSSWCTSSPGTKRGWIEPKGQCKELSWLRGATSASATGSFHSPTANGSRSSTAVDGPGFGPFPAPLPCHAGAQHSEPPKPDCEWAATTSWLGTGCRCPASVSPVSVSPPAGTVQLAQLSGWVSAEAQPPSRVSQSNHTQDRGAAHTALSLCILTCQADTVNSLQSHSNIF